MERRVPLKFERAQLTSLARRVRGWHHTDALFTDASVKATTERVSEITIPQWPHRLGARREEVVRAFGVRAKLIEPKRTWIVR